MSKGKNVLSSLKTNCYHMSGLLLDLASVTLGHVTSANPEGCAGRTPVLMHALPCLGLG